MAEYTHVVYKCSYCGLKSDRHTSAGRPDPGTCPRKPKTKDGRGKPHSWVIDRKY